MSFDIQTFQPTGKVSAEFLQCTDAVRFIMGPIGSAKTTTSLFDGIRHAAIAPVCIDGVRRFKGMILRNSYRDLYSTTIPSWLQWFPKSVGNWTGGADRPARHELMFDRPDGSRMEMIMEFRALGDDRVEDALRGWEGTWAYMNEADLMSQDVLDYLTSRVGRYPSKRLLPEGVNAWNGVIGDLNAPDIDSWVYTLFEETRPKNYKLFKQPSGFSPNAENLKNLPDDYYSRHVGAKEEWWIRRYIKNEYGFSRDGKPVFPEFQDDVHMASGVLKPREGVPLLLGMDAGMTPACVIAQWLPDGKWLFLEEIIPGHCGPTRFADLVKTVLAQKYSNFKVGKAFADPSAAFGGDKEGGDLAWLETVARSLGIPVFPAPSNEINIRLDAVRQVLTYFPDGEPAFLMSTACPVMRKAFNSHYRFKAFRAGNVERHEAKPEKNEFSHVMDGAQYVILGAMGRHGVIKGILPSQNPQQGHSRPKRTSLQTNFNVMNV